MTEGSAYTLDTGRKIRSLISKFVQPNMPYALLDWPNYDNVGDSAIWLGARQVLEELAGAPPTFVSRGATYPAHLDRVMPEGTVFLLGGGNFGDIYTNYQENRHRILANFGQREIVQLPQSLHFSNLSAIRNTAKAIAGHSKFTLLVRDNESLELARGAFDCSLDICPDLAFGMGPIMNRQSSTIDVFGLMRDDVEGVGHGQLLSTIGQSVGVQDWLIDVGRPLRSGFSYSLSRKSAAWAGQAMPWISRRFDNFARLRLTRGIEQLAQGKVVVTDRLHGHILSTMMGKRHLVLDNSYGKIARYRAAWPGDDLAIAKKGDSDLLTEVRGLLVASISGLEDLEERA